MLLFYTATLMPFNLAFVDGEPWDGWFVTDLIMDFLFFIDILIIFNTAYTDNEGLLIGDRCKIAKKYILSWFLFDLLACVPMGLIEAYVTNDKNGNNYDNLIRLFRLHRLPRIMRLARAVKFFKHC